MYLWQLFGGANQLMAALALILVTVWLASVGKNWVYAGLPALFMYVTTCAAILVTAYNLYTNVYQINLAAGRMAPVVGAVLMIVVALLLVAAALYIGFDSLRLRPLRETPADLLAEPKAPEEMRYAELGRYIDALARSGTDHKKLRVKQALKIAVPFTCIVIAFFGAPLAISTPRQGGAVGIAISLGCTVVFLIAVQLSQAVGAGGVIPPVLAAWLPNLLFGTAALVLLKRART